jgi:predicted nucleotidyltransferase
VGTFLEAVVRRAPTMAGGRAVALVGSHAAGRARPDSDVDLVVLVDDPGHLLGDRSWVGDLGGVAETTIEEWGAGVSRRVRCAAGLKVEGVGPRGRPPI